LKTIVHTDTARRKDKLLHVEAEGCVVNINIGLTNDQGRSVTFVEIIPDKYQGEEWDIEGDKERKGHSVRVIRRSQK